MQPEDYESFLVRLWRDHPGYDGRGGWRGEIEHIQTGTRWSFSTLGDLLAFLHQAVVAPHAVTQPASDEPYI
jgi:hypothetical protein